MGGADGVASHLFHGDDLADKGGFVDGCTQGTEVVVEADAFDFTGDAIELETALA